VISRLDAAPGGCDECAEAPEGPVPRQGTTSRQRGMAWENGGIVFALIPVLGHAL